MATSPQLGDILPARQLRPLAGGSAVAIGPRRTRAQVVVVTHPHPCEACASYLASLQDVAQRVSAEKADVLAVVGPAWPREAGEGPPLPIPAFVADDETTSALSRGGTPVVTVADRFGQVFAWFDAGPDHRFPTHAEILTTVLNIAISCPECGVPDVPCLTTLPDAGTMSGGMRIGQ